MPTSQRNQQRPAYILSEEAAQVVRAAADRWACTLEEAVLIILGLRPPPASTM